MINRAKMPRQMYGLGSLVKDRIRKLIPNELASVAVKAAPVVSVFNPGVGALMRGIGRFDQRGSISDALKQGAGTFAFGRGVGMLGGAQAPETFLGRQRFTQTGFDQGPIGRLFDRQAAQTTKDVGSDIVDEVALTSGDKKGVISVARDLARAGIKKLPDGVVAQLTAGGITAGASLLASYFQGEFEEPEPGETPEQYMERRREYVGQQMRVYMDNYFANDPEYMKLDEAGKDALVARYNIRDGGRVGYQTGGISMANTLAENIARNKANQAAISKVFQAAASRAFPEGKFQQIKASSPTQKDYNIKATKDLVENLPGGIVKDALAPAAAAVLSLPYDAIQASQRMEPGSGIAGFVDAFKAENPISSLKERTIGAAGPLAERISGENLIPGFTKVEGGYQGPDGQIYGPETYASIAAGMYPNIYDPRANVAKGGMPTGIMTTNKAGVKERDYRETGGFVPVGVKEKADDVPAMLSKNEFVFTADAVRGAGGGSIEKGAQKMYDTMKRLEKRVV